MEVLVEIYDVTRQGESRGEGGLGDGCCRVAHGIFYLYAKLLGGVEVYVVHTRGGDAYKFQVGQLAHGLAVDYHLVRDGYIGTAQTLYDLLFSGVLIGCVVALRGYLLHIATRDTILIQKNDFLHVGLIYLLLFTIFRCAHLANERAYDYRGATYAEECGDIGYGAHVRLLVLLLA